MYCIHTHMYMYVLYDGYRTFIVFCMPLSMRTGIVLIPRNITAKTAGRSYKCVCVCVCLCVCLPVLAKPHNYTHT